MPCRSSCSNNTINESTLTRSLGRTSNSIVPAAPQRNLRQPLTAASRESGILAASATHCHREQQQRHLCHPLTAASKAHENQLSKSVTQNNTNTCFIATYTRTLFPLASLTLTYRSIQKSEEMLCIEITLYS